MTGKVVGRSRPAPEALQSGTVEISCLIELCFIRHKRHAFLLHTMPEQGVCVGFIQLDTFWMDQQKGIFT